MTPLMLESNASTEKKWNKNRQQIVTVESILVRRSPPPLLIWRRDQKPKKQKKKHKIIIIKKQNHQIFTIVLGPRGVFKSLPFSRGNCETKMEWWSKMTIPMRKVCSKVSKGIRFRKSGHRRFRHDVRTCEYEDVQILWNMLKSKETHLSRSKKSRCWKFVDWAKCAPLLCRGS